MKKKFLAIALASVMLFGGVGAIVTPVQPVKAVSKLAAVSYAKGYHKVKLTKRVQVAKIHLRIPRYKSYVSNKHYLAKGKTVYIWRTGTDFGWYLKTSRHSKVTYTIYKRYNDSSWYRLK